MQRKLCGEKERAHPAHDDGQRVARRWDDEQQVSINLLTPYRSKIKTPTANVSVRRKLRLCLLYFIPSE